MINSKSFVSKNYFHKGRAVLEERVTTYVIHLLGTYVTILCNWLILWQNALYLYLGRSGMCLYFKKLCFKIKCESHISLSQIQAKMCKLIKGRQLASIEFEELFQSSGSTAARQIGICGGSWKTKFQLCFDSNPWLYVWAFFSHNPRHIKWLF